MREVENPGTIKPQIVGYIHVRATAFSLRKAKASPVEHVGCQGRPLSLSVPWKDRLRRSHRVINALVSPSSDTFGPAVVLTRSATSGGSGDGGDGSGSWGWRFLWC